MIIADKGIEMALLETAYVLVVVRISLRIWMRMCGQIGSRNSVLIAVQGWLSQRKVQIRLIVNRLYQDSNAKPSKAGGANDGKESVCLGRTVNYLRIISLVRGAPCLAH